MRGHGASRSVTKCRAAFAGFEWPAPANASRARSWYQWRLCEAWPPSGWLVLPRPAAVVITVGDKVPTTATELPAAAFFFASCPLIL
jgi:hypothetical protein